MLDKEPGRSPNGGSGPFKGTVTTDNEARLKARVRLFGFIAAAAVVLLIIFLLARG